MTRVALSALAFAAALALPTAAVPARPRPRPDLAVDIRVTPRPVAPGALARYLVFVTNEGRRAARSVTLTLAGTLPLATSSAERRCSAPDSAGRIRCRLSSLRPGSEAVFHAFGTVPTSASSIRASATVQSATRERVRRNNRASVRTAVRPPAAVPPPASVLSPRGEVALMRLSWCWREAARSACVTYPTPSAAELPAVEAHAGEGLTFRLGFTPTAVRLFLTHAGGTQAVNLAASATPTWTAASCCREYAASLSARAGSTGWVYYAFGLTTTP